MPYKYRIIAEVRDSANTIYDLEQLYKKNKKKFKYNPSINFSGKTECYKQV